MRARAIYKRFRDAVELQGLDAAGVEAMSERAVCQTASGAGLTQTFLKNMRDRLAARLRQREAESTAAWIESTVRGRFAQAQARVRRGRVIEVRLDGFGEEGEV